MTDDSIIQLDVGYKRVKQEGIDPFVRFIETGEREFFKAKEFVTLYDLIFKMSAHHTAVLTPCPQPLLLVSVVVLHGFAASGLVRLPALPAVKLSVVTDW